MTESASTTEVVRAAEAIVAEAAASEPVKTFPTPPLSVGSSFTAENGLEVTVLGLRTIEDDEPSEEPPRHIVLRARVANPGDEDVEFENNFGVIDPAGNAYRYRWMNPAKHADVLPGVANLEPGSVIEGEAHIMLPTDQRTPVEMLRPSMLRMTMDACGACEQELQVATIAIWSDGRDTERHI